MMTDNKSTLLNLECVWKNFRIWHEKNRSLRGFFLGTGNRGQAQELWALKDISFSLKEGEILGIIGPNGSGKTTLLKLISQIYPPSRGNISINGRISALLELGVGFNPELTGIDNILLYAAVHGINRKNALAMMDNIMNFAGLSDFADVPVQYYSSGMVARLGFSAATLIEPDILLIDEIYAVGDGDFQDKSIAKINEMIRASRGIILVSHNMHLIKNLCTRVLYLDKSELKALGPATETVNLYLQNQGIIPPAKESLAPPTQKSPDPPENGQTAPKNSPRCPENGPLNQENSPRCPENGQTAPKNFPDGGAL